MIQWLAYLWRALKGFFLGFFLVFTGAFCLLIGWRIWLNFIYSPVIYDSPQNIEVRETALVFGAGIRNNRPSHALADRIEGAVSLYQAGKVTRLLMTGDNSSLYYNEPAVMRQYAIELGVPAEAIALDHAGFRTYDSCYRANAVFELDSVIVVTHQFHQARALYLCNAFGVDAIGYIADKRDLSRNYVWWQIRETVAIAYAWFDVNIEQPTPFLGDKIYDATIPQ